MYNHDITHCRYEQCTKKDTCYRYLAHLDAVKRKLTYLTYLVIDNCVIDDINNNKCPLYWEIKQ